MSLMEMRQRIKENATSSLLGRESREEPSVGRVVLQSTIATILGVFSFLKLLGGQESAASGVAIAGVFALLAHLNWQRIKEARAERFLPHQILCPSCEATITLNDEERRAGRFSCASCGDDFEITDE